MNDNNPPHSLSQDFIYGIHPVREAIEAGKVIERLFIQREIKSPAIKNLIKVAQQHDVNIIPVPVGKLNRITRKLHQGVICFLSPVEYHDIRDSVQSTFENGLDPLVLMLDRVTDVRNFGSICRTAECMGVTAVLVPEKGGAMINSDAIKTSAGAVSRVTLCREHNLKSALQYLKEAGLKIVSCTEKGASLLSAENLQGPLVLIMGSEENGVSPEYIKLSDHAVKIPMKGAIASLNVSVAAGMILYEVASQRLKGNE
jgi:23S rRNA (guanosine2251-2'-O)-methyltransferase